MEKILREIAVEGLTLEEYELGNLDVVLQQKTRQLDTLFKKKALERVVVQFYTNHFNKLIMEEEFEKFLPLFKDIKADINKFEEKTNYIFINVNPAPNHALLYFQQVIEKSLKKVWIKDYCYVLEQRGETLLELGKGFHTHIIIEKTPEKPYSQCIKELGRSFSKVCDTSNFHLYSGAIIKESDINKRREYILGVKNDTQKHLKQQMDIIWRKTEYLKTFYGNSQIGLKDN